MEEVCEKFPETANLLKIQKIPGRLTIKMIKKVHLKIGVFDTFLNIVTLSCEAHGRRLTEVLRCCQTLNDLNEKLKEFGFNISKSATY